MKVKKAHHHQNNKKETIFGKLPKDISSCVEFQPSSYYGRDQEYGLFSKRNVSYGEPIFLEKAFLWYDKPPRVTEMGELQNLFDFTCHAIEREYTLDRLGEDFGLTRLSHRLPESKGFMESLLRLNYKKSVSLARLLYFYRIRISMPFTESYGGTGLFRYASMMNHSCEPNCRLLPVNNKDGTVVAIAQRDIKCGDELMFSYLQFTDITAPTMTKLVTEREYGFVCRCPRCTIHPVPEALEDRMRVLAFHWHRLLAPFRLASTGQFDDAIKLITDWGISVLLDPSESSRPHLDLVNSLSPTVIRWVMRSNMDHAQLKTTVVAFWMTPIRMLLKIRRQRNTFRTNGEDIMNVFTILLGYVYMCYISQEDLEDLDVPALLEFQDMLSHIPAHYLALESSFIPRLHFALALGNHPFIEKAVETMVGVVQPKNTE